MVAIQSRDDKEVAGFFSFLSDLLSEKLRARAIIPKCVIDLASTLSLGWNKEKFEGKKRWISFVRFFF